MFVVVTTLYTKKGVIAFLFAKSSEFLENIRFLIKNGVSNLTLPIGGSRAVYDEKLL